MRAAGLSDVNPSHATLRVLVEAGATLEELEVAARGAAQRGKGFAYALAMVKRERIEAARLAAQVHHGPLPTKPLTERELERQDQRAFMDGLTGRTRHNEAFANNAGAIDVESRVIQ